MLLRLSVDTETVAKQMFEPLVLQLVHWFTQNMQIENRETMALLDALMDGLSDDKNGALRDACSDLLAEFLKWSIKHNQRNKLSNVKSLFQRLYSFFQHPNPYRRLGAALAFNKMYRIFREVDEIVDIHILDLLHNTIQSMKLANDDDPLLGSLSSPASLLFPPPPPNSQANRETKNQKRNN